jgi:hypothetical protein
MFRPSLLVITIMISYCAMIIQVDLVDVTSKSCHLLTIGGTNEALLSIDSVKQSGLRSLMHKFLHHNP